jgi:peptidoglycan/LPS O-acetylase OafA/YrhL
MTVTREKFHTFDSLRFFAFILVFMWHMPYQLFPGLSFLKLRGDASVYLFFTLSGFLITYIVLQEKQAFGNFNFKNFMVRRILRIWPLYYLVVLFAFCTPYLLSLVGISGNSNGYEPNWLYSALFLENYMIMAHHGYANVSPLPVTWTVCIEEHYYIIWGIVLYFSKMKHIPYWIGFFIALAFLSRVFFLEHGMYFKDILTNFDYFMYGAIPAWLYLNYRKKTLGKVESIPYSYKFITVCAVALYAVFGLYYYFPGKELIEPLFFGLLYMGLIFILLPKQNRFRLEDSNIFSKWGTYAYGMYLFHVIIINLAKTVYEKSGLVWPDWIVFTAIFLFAGALTIVAGRISFIWFEKPLMRLKPKH